MAAPAKPPVVHLLLLGLLLIVFPIGSYLYINSGGNYRLESLGELERELGRASDFGLPDSLAQPVVRVVYQSPAAPEDSVYQAIAALQEMLSDQRVVQFVGLGEGVIPEPDAPQMFAAELSPSGRASFAELGNESEFCARTPATSRAYIIDVHGSVVRCYDLRSGKEVNRILEQSMILAPRAEEADIILERDPEY